MQKDQQHHRARCDPQRVNERTVSLAKDKRCTQPTNVPANITNALRPTKYSNRSTMPHATLPSLENVTPIPAEKAAESGEALLASYCTVPPSTACNERISVEIDHRRIYRRLQSIPLDLIGDMQCRLIIPGSCSATKCLSPQVRSERC